MTLLERFDKMVSDAWVIGTKEDIEKLRCDLAIAQAVEDIDDLGLYGGTLSVIYNRANELLERKTNEPT